MGYSFSVWEEARNAISILELLERYGFPIRRVGSSWRSRRCPACGESPDPQSVRLTIFDENNYWYCHRCKTKGDVIDAVAIIEGISRQEAAEAIVEFTGWHPKTKIQSLEEIKKKEKEKRKAKTEIVNLLLRIAQETPGTRRQCWRYLIKDRSLPVWTIKRALKKKILLFLPNLFRVRREVEERIPRDLMEKAGLQSLPLLVGRRPIVAPFNLYFEENGGRGAEFRAINGAKPKTITIGPKGFWFWPGIFPEHCLVTEGFVDLLSALAMGWRGSILGLPGVQDIKRVPASFWKGKEVWLALDGDEAGWEATRWALSKGIAKYVFKIPKEKDLNDLLRAGIRTFRDLSYQTVS